MVAFCWDFISNELNMLKLKLCNLKARTLFQYIVFYLHFVKLFQEQILQVINTLGPS